MQGGDEDVRQAIFDDNWHIMGFSRFFSTLLRRNKRNTFGNLIWGNGTEKTARRVSSQQLLWCEWNIKLTYKQKWEAINSFPVSSISGIISRADIYWRDQISAGVTRHLQIWVVGGGGRCAGTMTMAILPQIRTAIVGSCILHQVHVRHEGCLDCGGGDSLPWEVHRCVVFDTQCRNWL